MALRPGDILAGKYEIISEIAEGGFGKVFLGHDLGMDRPVAIKELLRTEGPSSLEDYAEYEVRFRKEARIVSKFSHPNVVSAYALESDENGSLYLISEYVGGGSLKNILEANLLLDSEQVVALGIDICNAIEAIYRRDIVHRDVKPSNILITEDGTAKLTDFGVAQLGHETRRTQTARGHPGTPAYKSPEQATATGYLDERSDLYSLGLVMYEMLTGKLYVRNYVPPEAYNPDASPLLSRVIMKVLEEDPIDRYQSAAEMREDLLRIQEKGVGTQLRTIAALANDSPIIRLLVPVLLVAAIAAIIWGAMQMIDTFGGRRAPTLTNTVPVVAPPTDTPRPSDTSIPPTDTPTPTNTVVPSATSTDTLVPTDTPIPSATWTPTVEPSTTPILTDQYELNDIDPSAIAVGETQTHNFYPTGDVDKVTFRTKPGRWYAVSTSNLAVGVDTRLELWIAGERYENDDANPGQLASLIRFRSPSDGMVVATITNLDQFGPDKFYDISVVELAPTLTPTPTGTLSPTSTPTNTGTNTPTNTPTRTDTPTWTPTVTWTPTITWTPTNTPVTPTDTPVPPTDTLVPTATDTPVPPTDTLIPTATNTQAPPTDTSVPTATDTQVPTETPVDIPTATDTPAPTDTEVPTETSSPDATNTPSG